MDLVAQFAVATARPRLGMRSIITLPVEGEKLLTLQTIPRTFAGQVSFCQANTLKTECVVDWIPERETTGPNLRFQRKTS